MMEGFPILMCPPATKVAAADPPLLITGFVPATATPASLKNILPTTSFPLEPPSESQVKFSGSLLAFSYWIFEAPRGRSERKDRDHRDLNQYGHKGPVHDFEGDIFYRHHE
jgi:hypothetical protein